MFDLFCLHWSCDWLRGATPMQAIWIKLVAACTWLTKSKTNLIHVITKSVLISIIGIIESNSVWPADISSKVTDEVPCGSIVSHHIDTPLVVRGPCNAKFLATLPYYLCEVTCGAKSATNSTNVLLTNHFMWMQYEQEYMLVAIQSYTCIHDIQPFTTYIWYYR